LMLPLALARGGAFRTMGLSLHGQTNREVIGMFLDVPMRVEEASRGVVVRVGA
jgi:RNA 3'-terminal phosphate cyclase